MRRLALLSLILVFLAPAGSASRRRAAHSPATECSFSLVPTWGNAPISASGVTRALVLVYGQTQECAGWAAYSPVDWITVEAAPMAAQPGALVTVAPNTATIARSATLAIAGIRLVVTQEAAATVAPPVGNPNLLANGTFDKDVSAWGWPRRDYPNGPGSPQWSQFDANGSPASGSMLLRDVDFLFGQAFQTLQCVRIQSGKTYAFGAKIRVGSSDGDAPLAFLTYQSSDCSGNYKIRNVQTAKPQPGIWQPFDYTQRVELEERSAVLVFGSAANTAPPFEVWIDDAYIREVK
ncbi:MAG TPA: BACON domain-containing carbohydrate-binding protein [Thermoanaerobaculia bacterium]|jgi:hypothetical protein|nr:BACON domain-containing carbohydrate-binding protein [Thermoanaerobaculia bacterium]